MRRRWVQVLVMSSALSLIVAGCGRVDLEDLTPEAVKTEQAVAAITATAEAEAAPDVGAAFTGNPSRGKVHYDIWCTGCHDGGRAEPILGEPYPLDEWEDFFRTGNGTDHPTYDPVIDLSDEDLLNIVTYIASAD